MAMKQLVKALLFRPGYRKHRVLAGSLRGMWFTFNLRGDTQQWRGIYETALQRWLNEHLGPGGVCLDIGAARGYFTLLSAKLAWPQGHVYAFEPSPLHKDVLTHLAMNSPGRLAAVSVHNRYVVSSPGGGADRITIDQFCDTERLSRLDAVKIDVDGAEVDVLRGMEETLARFHPQLFVEVHSRELLEEVREITTRHGYRMKLEHPPAREYRPCELNAFFYS